MYVARSESVQGESELEHRIVMNPEEPTRNGKRPSSPGWEKHRKQLLALRSHLEAERRNHLLAVSEPLENFSMSMADAAADEFDHNLALSLLSAEQAAIYEIDEALARIENGMYGICEITGQPIPEARLNVLPWTRFSGRVEQDLERAGISGRIRFGALKSASGKNIGKLVGPEMAEEPATPPACDETFFPVRIPPK